MYPSFPKFPLKVLIANLTNYFWFSRIVGSLDRNSYGISILDAIASELTALLRISYE